MIPVMCLVQEGQIAPSVGEQLRSSLSALSQKTLGVDAAISWLEVKAGNGFTEAKPSTSSLVSMLANRPLAQAERVRIMQDICDVWMAATDCSINEIVAAVRDPES